MKKELPSLLVACDVCLCPYTDHGHCGILDDASGFVKVERFFVFFLSFISSGMSSLKVDDTLDAIASIARSFALAGADIVAPSDTMDGRIRAIKEALAGIGYLNRVSGNIFNSISLVRS